MEGGYNALWRVCMGMIVANKKEKKRDRETRAWRAGIVPK